MFEIVNAGALLRAVAAASIFFLVYTNIQRYLKPTVETSLSFVINQWLLFCHPIRSADAELTRYIPTVAWKFPNGQGDVEKFLDGYTNSTRWGGLYGPIYRIWSGTKPEIVLTRPEDVQAVFKDSDKHIKAKDNSSGYLMSQLLGDCVGLISQHEWKRVRTFCEPAFLRSNSSSHIAISDKCTEQHFQGLWETSKLAEGTLDPREDLKMLPFWIIAKILYGELSRDDEKELTGISRQREHLHKYVINGGLSRYSWSSYIPFLPSNRELAAFQSRWFAFNQRIYRAALSTKKEIPLISMYQHVLSGEMSRAELFQTIDEMLFTNLDVTLGAISWNPFFLAAHPTVQSKLREEVLDRIQQGHDAMNDYIMKSQTFLAACISESARLKPLAAFSVAQAAPTARVVCGYRIPAGTNFIVDSYAINQRHSFWGLDSLIYRPERFLEKAPHEYRYQYWRFGFGARQCLGKWVADVILRVLLVHLVKEYDLSLLDKDRDWERNPEVWINHPVGQIRCTKRS